MKKDLCYAAFIKKFLDKKRLGIDFGALLVFI